MFGTEIDLTKDNTKFFKQLDNTGIKWSVGKEVPSQYQPSYSNKYILCLTYEKTRFALLTEDPTAQIISKKQFIEIVKILQSQHKEINKILGIKEEILDKEEKEYLSAVIKPFRGDVKNIVLVKWGCYDAYIRIMIKDRDSGALPIFEKNTMYKGMELDKEYTLEELGL